MLEKFLRWPLLHIKISPKVKIHPDVQIKETHHEVRWMEILLTCLTSLYLGSNFLA